MNKSESLVNLTKAVIKAMTEVKGIEKNLTVGEGKNSYSGVADKDVKLIIGDAMQKNGLSIFCTDIEETTDVSQWDEVDPWSKSTPKDIKRKQSVFTKVVTTYLLCHESGEYITLKGFGHGVDSQDKSAGKATTYALKYALLYTFLVPTGKIDDADTTHSDDIKPPVKETTKIETGVTWMTEIQFNKIKKALLSGDATEIEKAKKNFTAFNTLPYAMKRDYYVELQAIIDGL